MKKDDIGTMGGTDAADSEGSEEEKFKFSDLKKLGFSFWLVAFSYMFTIMVICEAILISSKVL